MYELFILSKLLHRPMHGYLIQSILNSAIGPHRKLSWGTLYPLLKRLEESGYIIAGAESDDPRGKKAFRTTEAGRRRFLALMKDSGEINPNTSEIFRIKIGCFGHIKPEVQTRILKDYRNHLAQIVAHSEAMADRVTQDANLRPTEQSFALLALNHRQAVAGFEIQWLNSVIEKA